MNIAIILDPLEQIKTYKDSTFAVMRAATWRGHALFVLRQEDMFWRAGSVMAAARRLDLIDNGIDWYTLGDVIEQPLQSFDVVLMRKDPPFDMEYVYSTYLLELAEAAGARIFNRPSAIRDFNEKLSIGKFPQLVAPTLVTRDMDRIKGFVAEQNEAVVKPLDGMGGASVFRVSATDSNRNVIIETLTQLGRRTVMAQRYIPEIAAGDKRILIINGKVVPYALARIPQGGESRGNLAAGGKGVAQPLSARDREIAATVAEAVKREGLFLVGLDVIGDYLTEINVTSPTGMQEITQQTGLDVAEMFVQELESVLSATA